MPAPAEPTRDTSYIHPASERSDTDETITAAGKPDSKAESGFAPPAADGEVGLLGPYRIVKELGRGGMGAVYAALDTRLDRKLALKVMLPQFAADASAKERFLREARAAAKISHDNVVTVYEADERQGVPYIAMQFLEGYPLDDYLKKKGTPTVPQILRIGMETAAGLAAAHKIGLVHRDIKPGNLWLESPNGRVKVLDFGLAKPVDADVELTKSGAVVGTPAYMSPEQARGEKVDSRTDLFSLGAVLYRLCANRLPFQGANTMAMLMALGTEEPKPVRELNPNIPESLAKLIHELLAKKADARPQTAMEVAKRIRAIAEELAAPRVQPTEQSLSVPQVVQPQVSYAVMPITAFQPVNPFADLDSPRTEAVTQDEQHGAEREETGRNKTTSKKTATPKSASPQTAPVKKSRNGTLWLTGGALAFAAIALASVIIIIKNKDGSETKIEVPDGSTVTLKDKTGKTITQVGPGKKDPPKVDPPPPPLPPVAKQFNGMRWPLQPTPVEEIKYFLSLGVVLKVRAGTTGDAELRPGDAIPDKPVSVVSVNFWDADASKVNDEVFRRLAKLTDLEVLSYNFKKYEGVTVTTEGSREIGSLVNLRKLEISHYFKGGFDASVLTKLRNLEILAVAGIPFATWVPHTNGLLTLRVIDAWGTDVTDEDYEQLAKVPSLVQVHTDNIAPSEEAMRALAKKLPWCRVSTGKYNKLVIEPTAPYPFSGLRIDQVNGTVAAEVPGLLAPLDSPVTFEAYVKFDRAFMGENPQFFGWTYQFVTGANGEGYGAGYYSWDAAKQVVKTYGASANVELARGSWHHIATVRDGKEVRFYLNGALASKYEVPLPLRPPVADPVAGLFLIGHMCDGVSLRDVRVSQVARYKGDKFQPAARLTSDKDTMGFYPCDEGWGLVLNDRSGNNRHGKLVNGSWVSAQLEYQIAPWIFAQGGTLQVNGEGKDLKAINELPRNNFAITAVSLRGTPITDTLLTNLKAIKGLTSLDLRETKVTLKGIQELHNGIPSCKILHDGGVIESSAAEIDYKAAKWVLEQGGVVYVASVKEVNDVAKLPKEITLWHVHLSEKVTDEGWALLSGCRNLTKISISGKPNISDVGLSHFRNSTQITELFLDSSSLTDIGLACFKNCKEMQTLVLTNTRITEASLVTLKEFKKLKSLNVKGTGLTLKGVQELHTAVPGCRIEHDGGVIEPKN